MLESAPLLSHARRGPFKLHVVVISIIVVVEPARNASSRERFERAKASEVILYGAALSRDGVGIAVEEKSVERATTFALLSS